MVFCRLMIPVCFSLILLLVGIKDTFAETCTLNFDSNISDDLKTTIQSDLAFLAGIRGNDASNLHRETFGAGPVSGSLYCMRLQRFIKTIVENSEDLLPTEITRYENGRLLLTKKYLEERQIYRISILIHESTHAGFPNHVNCPASFGAPLAGLPGCDLTEYEAYGVQATWLINVGKFCANCDSETMKFALAKGLQLSKRILISQSRRRVEEQAGGNDGL
jgi:hypothetical protein